jgi:hypothetical protein
VETAERTGVELVDLATTPLRELNRRLHEVSGESKSWRILNPNGAHAIACGLDAEIDVEIQGHVGYYCAGMNKLATVRVNGNERPLARTSCQAVLADGASQSAGASGHGGLFGGARRRRPVAASDEGHRHRRARSATCCFTPRRVALASGGDAGEALGD